jgi:hypothetical protein
MVLKNEENGGGGMCRNRITVMEQPGSVTERCYMLSRFDYSRFSEDRILGEQEGRFGVFTSLRWCMMSWFGGGERLVVDLLVVVWFENDFCL